MTRQELIKRAVELALERQAQEGREVNKNYMDYALIGAVAGITGYCAYLILKHWG